MGIFDRFRKKTEENMKISKEKYDEFMDTISKDIDNNPKSFDLTRSYLTKLEENELRALIKLMNAPIENRADLGGQKYTATFNQELGSDIGGVIKDILKAKENEKSKNLLGSLLKDNTGTFPRRRKVISNPSEINKEAKGMGLFSSIKGLFDGKSDEADREISWSNQERLICPRCGRIVVMNKRYPYYRYAVCPTPNCGYRFDSPGYRRILQMRKIQDDTQKKNEERNLKEIENAEKERLKIPRIRSPGIREKEDIINIANKFAEANREIMNEREIKQAEQKRLENAYKSQEWFGNPLAGVAAKRTRGDRVFDAAVSGVEKTEKLGGHMSRASKVFSKNVCPYCHYPTVEIAGRHYCTRPSCPYSKPQNCPLCGEPLSVDKKGFICLNKGCEFSKNPEKLREHIKTYGYGMKGEHLEKKHRSRVLRTALIMMLGIIPMIFPGGMAGVMFLLGIWSIALEMFFPRKPKSDTAMVFKGTSRVAAIGFFTAGLFFTSSLLSFGMLLLGYYSLPTGSDEHNKYRQLLGFYKLIFAIFLGFLAFSALGGPANFKISLGLFVFAFLFTVPFKKVEVLEAMLFIILSTAGMIFGLIALGTANLAVVSGFAILAIGLLLYTASKIPSITRRESEEADEKAKDEKQDEDEERERKDEEKEEEKEEEKTAEKQKIAKIDKDMGVV